jgi:Uma2 family endonuclease
MDTWIANGAKLGWLIDPYNRNVLVYERGETVRVEAADKVTGTGAMEGFVLDLAAVWSLYED